MRRSDAEELPEVLNDFRDVALRRDHAAAAARLLELAERLDAHRFHMVVLGAFKRGKSTFVNALIGARILPVGVLPLTSVATFVRHGTRPGACIRFRDGSTREVAVEELAAFVTEAGNPENRAGVVRVDVRAPAPLLAEGVVLIDTPGVGSVYEHNTASAEAVLSEVDAAVVLTSADAPISAEERAFLGRIRAHAAKTFVVVNKVDLLSREDAEAVQTFTADVVREAIGAEVEVFALSAERALSDGDEGFDVFVDRLEVFLSHARRTVLVASIAGKGAEVAKRLRSEVRLEADALGRSVEEIELRLEAVRSIRAEAEQVRDDISVLLQRAASGLVATIEDDLAGWRDEETEALLRSAESFRAHVAPAELEPLVRQRLRDDVDAWRPTEDVRLAASFERAIERFVAQAEREAARAVDACAQVLDIEISSPFPFEGLHGKSRFSHAPLEPPTILQSLLPDVRTALPKKTAAKVAERRVRERIPMLVDRYSGRMRYDLVERVNESVRGLDRVLTEHLTGILSGLETALSSAESHVRDTATTTARRHELTALDQELRTWAGRLMRIRDAAAAESAPVGSERR